ncbi:MAG: hypothetical protein OSA94_12015 [Yoonia sp.]|nr:hypothetical protein [Yoonia sp.]
MNIVSKAPIKTPFIVSQPLADVIEFALQLEHLSDAVLVLNRTGEMSKSGFGPSGTPSSRGRIRQNIAQIG